LPKPASASVRLPSAALACILLLELMLPHPVAGGGPPPEPANPETESPAELEGLGYDPDWVQPAEPAPISVPGDEGAAGGLDPSIQLRPDVALSPPPEAPNEVPSLRTEYSHTTANPDGSFTREVSQSRVNYLDAQGAWQPIDLSLVPDRSGVYDLSVAANDRTVRFDADDADRALATVAFGGSSISLRALDYGRGVESDRTVEFQGAGNRGAVGVSATELGFAFHVTLDSPAQTPVYHFALDLEGLTASLARDGQSIDLVAAHEVGFAAEDGVAGAEGGLISPPVLLQGSSEEGISGRNVDVNLARPWDTDLPAWVSSDALDALADDEYLLSYRIDPDWLRDPERVFPVILDPTVCIGGQSGCTSSPPSFDEFIFSYNPNAHATGWTVVRTGYDNRTSDGGIYNALRGLFYFPDITLGDGRILTSASLELTIDQNFGNAVGKPLQVYRVNRAWATNSVDWGDMTVPTNGWDASPISPAVNVPSGTNPKMTFTVTDLVRSWYTRRGADWKPNIGLMVRYVTESASTGETTFRKTTAATVSHRPKLTLTYEEPAVAINFDPALGATFAPSTMVAGQLTKLPIRVTNNSGITFDTTNWRIGYRWFDNLGTEVGSSAQLLTTAIGPGTTSATFALNVTPPSTIGQYTLRLDLVRVVGGVNRWASDWATPSLYYSRNKAILTSDSTRWTGSSVIQRDEFGIGVTAGGGSQGELRWVTLGDGSRIGVNLGTRNLRLEGDTGLGTADLIDLALTYGYDRANNSDCSGILDACGWYTNWDERFTPLVGGYTGQAYTYQAPSGDRYFAGIDPEGQLVSGAPVQLERPNVTLWDESNLNWTVGTPPVVSTAYAYSGTHSLSISAANTGTEASFFAVDPRHYPVVSLWVKSTGTNKAAIGFRIVDLDNGSAVTWFFYTFGSTSWSVPGFPSLFINTGTAMTSTGGYYLNSRNLFADARATIPSLSKSLRIANIDLRGSAGGTGSLYYDAVAFDGASSLAFDDAHPAWTAYAQSGLSTDRIASSYALKITSASVATSPDCAGCTNSDLTQYSFLKWWWKKVGGSAIAFVVHLKDTRSNAVGDITYYAGPAPPDGAPNPVRVSPTLPTEWTPVTRNVLADARQILGFFNDNPTGSNPSAPPSAPIPDPVTMTGYRLSGVDGQFGLFDYANLMTLGRVDGSAVAEDDFAVTYPGRTVHFFNHDGLLERIVDRDGNTVALDWSFDYGSSGPSAYTLTAIRAAGDGLAVSGGTAQREIVVTNGTTGSFRQWTFSEQLGSTSAYTGRRADFYVATTTGTTYGSGDLVKVSGARHNSSTCPATRPSGCTEYDYLTATGHELDEIRDPRWDGSPSGSADFRFDVTYNAGSPLSITDRSRSSAALLYVASFDTGTSTTYPRALVQDAAGRAAQTATFVDLVPGGSAATTYVPKPCTSGQCTTSSGTFPASPASTDVALTNQFDGLTRVSTQTQYRVTGAAPELVVSRRATSAGAKVDNDVDALAGGELVWSQTPDQYLASLRDSGGTHPDLYRSEYAYNAYHEVISRSDPHFNRRASYPAAVNLPNYMFPVAYWRLDETAGSTAADSSGNGYTGTISATGVTKNQAGAMSGDASPAMLFNGSTGRITSTVSVPQSGYTLSAWVRVLTDYSADVNGRGIAGRWLNNSGALLWLYRGRPYLVHGNNYLDGGTQLALNRWYHVAATWNGAVAQLYLDGQPIAAKLVTTAPGSGASNFEIATYQNGPSSTAVNATLDEVAVHDKQLTSAQIQNLYLAGRAMARQTVLTTYDGEGHPLEVADHFITNGGFENGLNAYDIQSGATAYSGPSGDPNIHSGFGSCQISGGSAIVRQDMQLRAGQTFRWQFAVRTDGGANTRGTYGLYYWQLSTSTWTTLVATSHLTSTWTTKAYDFTIPFDSDGRVRFGFWNSGGTGTAWFDDALIVTEWGQTAYAANGLVTDTYLLQPGSSSAATLRTNNVMAASSAHPAIFPTTEIVNYVDGTYTDTIRDEDLATTRTFDAWGRVLATTDPDGVTQTTTYAGNQTDVASVSDGLVTTAFTSDAVGNRLTSSVAGEVTTSTYDLRNHPLSVTAPDGTVTQHTINDFGQRTASIANYVDGTPSGAGGTDDLKTTYAYDEYGRLTTTITDTGYAGSPDATTVQTYDRLGTVITSTAFAGPGAAGPRTTTHRFETYTTGGSAYTRASPSGVQLPIAPTGSPARPCPGSGGGYCNTVATWLRNGAWVSAVDMNGVAFAQADAYGTVTLTDTDLAGRPVQVIANFVAGAGSTADQNVTTAIEYNLAGRERERTDPMGRVTVTTYDDVDRPIQVDQQDPALPDIRTKTVYTAAGRVDRVAAPDTTGQLDANRNWTRTEYDAAGRAVRTLEHFDITGIAHLRIDGFETGSDGWAGTATGFFTTAAAGSVGLDTEFHAVAPATGNGRLRVTTAATANSGAWWDVSGQTYTSGLTYHLHADVRGPAGTSIEALFGVDAAGSNYASTGAVSLTGTWQALELNWTPNATVSANVHVALRKPSSGAVDVYLDNVQVYATADPAWNIPTETAYDPTGRITASLLPPGHPGEAPLVTTTAYDLASRPVSVTVNATRAYSHQVVADGATNGLVAYYPLDERTVTTATDVKGGLNATFSGAYRLAQAGGVDENRTAVAFDGVSGTASRSANVSAATNNFSLEAWFRRDAAGTNQVIVHNGTSGTGWGLGLDASGNLAARFETTGWLSTGVSPSIGVWHHAVVVRNAGTTTIYLDGTAYTPSNATAAPSAPGAGFSIGRQAAGSRPFAGSVDEVAVYTTALAAGAVSSHWTAGHPTAADARLTTRSAYDALGRATEELSPRGILTRFTLDRLGRTTATTANYRDGAPASATSDDDVTATAAYNALGELLGTCSPAQVFVGGCVPSSGSEDQAWRYAYDAMGHQVSQVPPVNQTATALSSRSWTYDAGGRLTSICDFAAGGTCATATRHTDFTYDPLGRELTRTVYQGSGTGSPKLSWTNTWNPDGSQGSVAFDGTASGEGTDALTFTYDGLGRPDQVKRASTVLTDYGWNADGTLASRVDGTLGTSSFSYDWADRLSTMSSPLWTGSLTWAYRLDGLLDTRQWPSGSSGQATLTYDAAKRPTAFAKVGSAAADFSQAYDRDGNVVSEGRALAGVPGDAGTATQAFAYDGLNRVTGSSGLTTTYTYTYDRDSNRLSADASGLTTTYAYDRTGVLLSRFDSPTTTYYAYDAYGNLTSHASAVNQNTTLTYDLADRLLTVVLPGPGNTTTAFSLDALGRIATRTPPGGSPEPFSYLGTSETVWSIGGVTSVSSALDPAGTRVASQAGAATGFLLSDLHGNVATATNSGETALLSATRYDPYGLTAASWDSGGGFPMPWRFQARLDLTSNPTDPLYEFSARFYLPATGTFSQLDTYAGDVGDPVSLHRYLYAAANPWTLIDPTGHAFTCGADGQCAGRPPPPPINPDRPAPNPLTPTRPPAVGTPPSAPPPSTPPAANQPTSSPAEPQPLSCSQAPPRICDEPPSRRDLANFVGVVVVCGYALYVTAEEAAIGAVALAGLVTSAIAPNPVSLVGGSAAALIFTVNFQHVQQSWGSCLFGWPAPTAPNYVLPPFD
jgi:RHS repeat-associated protein